MALNLNTPASEIDNQIQKACTMLKNINPSLAVHKVKAKNIATFIKKATTIALSRNKIVKEIAEDKKAPVDTKNICQKVNAFSQDVFGTITLKFGKETAINICSEVNN